MSVQLHPEAQREFAEAANWYEARGVGLGEAFADEVLRALDVIEDSPGAWPQWPGVRHMPPVRRFLLSGFPFALPYGVLKGQVIILAVAHLRRRPGYWLKRTQLLWPR